MAYQKTEIPRRGCRQLVCRDVALFSPLNWGEGSAAARHPWASLPSPFPLGDGLAAAAVRLPFSLRLIGG